MTLVKSLKDFPLIDLGLGHQRHTTRAKTIGFEKVTRFQSVANKTLLDVGCGDGYWSDQATAKGYTVTSIDHEKYYANTQVVDLDSGLAFSDESFDVVWCSEVLEHLYDPVAMIKEIKRVLKQQGLLVLTSPNSYFWLYTVVLRLLGKSAKDVQNPDHKQFFKYRDIAALFPRAEIYGFFPYTPPRFAISGPRMVHYLSPSFTVVCSKEDL
jgi:2-polyprenyl-3-methyl-5-hydroxy-6-metoxy-1,4-benzoquinol methylase